MLGKNIRKLNRKGVAAVRFLQAAVIGLVIAIITLTIGIQVNDTITTSMTANSAARNASALGTTGLATFSGYWSIIAIVIILAVIIALFGMFGGQQR